MSHPTHPQRDFYTSIAERFDTLVHPYDQTRRVEIIFDELLVGLKLAGLLVLDDGCGTGAVALPAQNMSARVIGSDISHAQLGQARRKGLANGVTADALYLPYPDACFDLILSSEMIEHTVDPARAVGEMARVLKPGGKLILTCPNRVWKWLVDLAVRIKVRPFEGLENFPTFEQVEHFALVANLRIERHEGFHPWPFQIPLWRISRWVDCRFGGSGWKHFMINQSLYASKPTHKQE